MNNSLLSGLRAARVHASFNGISGYRLDGDLAYLNADVCVAPEAAGEEWALQLWACNSSRIVPNIKIAELPLGSLPHQALSVDGWAAALPPAGEDSHIMALTLAHGQNGVFCEIHDIVSFPQAARFVQPCFEGEAVAHWSKDSVTLSTPSICNPRDAENLSGTLSIELWALSEAYGGGAFEGLLLAQEQIGSLAGQTSVRARSLAVTQAPVPPAAVIMLMLREWTAVGYVTRDFREIQAAPEMAGIAEVPVTVKSEEPAKSAKPPVKAKAEIKGKTKPAKAAITTNASAQVETAPAGKTRSVIALPADKRVSINSASLDELIAVKGLSRPVASAIVAGRPYAALDDLLDVKGMGERLLAKLRACLST